MMKNKAIFPVAFAIMMMALLSMAINLTVVSLPDWAVRITGIVMLADLAVLSYLTLRVKHNNDERKQ